MHPYDVLNIQAMFVLSLGVRLQEDIHHSDDLSVIPEEDRQMTPTSNGSVPFTESEVVAIADGGTEEQNDDAENEASESDTDEDLEDM